TIGIGIPCDDPADLPQSTAGARSALDYRSMVGRGQAIYIGDLEPGAVVRITFGEGDERALTAAVKMGDEEEVRTEVRRLADRLKDRLTEANVPLSQCQLFFLSLLTCLLKMTRDGGLKTEKVFGEDFNGTMQVTDFASVEELGQWCLDRCLNIQTGIRRQRTDSAGRMVEKAKDFIQAHYAESELSVEMLCEYLHLSPAYFSTIFKRQMGMSFTGYVTVVRMEAAAERLRNTEEKTYLIARACGYEDPNYFSYVFKRHFGMSPTKY
ncbi:two component transcriptional regulator, AraC family, partial [gut metagenome]